MGEQIEIESVTIFNMKTGKSFKLSGADLEPEDGAAPENEISRVIDAAAAEITAQIIARRMSRKRFVKLMMARGCDKRAALRLADGRPSGCKSYGMYYLLGSLTGLLPPPPKL